MEEQEKRRISHFIILISYTIFIAAFMVEGALLGWDPSQGRWLLAMLAAAWVLRIVGKLPRKMELGIYLFVISVGLWFYGSHKSSMYDLAPVIIVFMLIFCAAEVYNAVWFSVALYFVVLLHGIFFSFWDSLVFTPLSVSRLFLHGALVCIAAYMIRYMTERHRNVIQSTKDRVGELEESNRRTEDFLTNVSHELRTPINAVTGLTSVMLKNEADKGKRENLLSVQKAGYRLFGQIEDILDYTEIDSGRLTASEDIYMLSSLVNDLITERDQTYEKPDLEVLFDVEAGIPAALVGDGRKIKKIMRHLLDNAIKFTEEGGVCVRIYALPKSYGINLCIQVMDTGIGVDQESLSRITERFYQSSRGRDRKAGGLGLGLPIVYGMAAAMEGFVHIESKAGKGTMVTVSIPQKISDDSPGMAVKNPSALCLGCYLIPEKYKTPEVREFYDGMITHLAEGLGVTVHRVFNREEMENLVSMYRLTHLFLAQQEYEQDPDYFEGLTTDTVVVVIVDRNFVPRENSRVKILPKPFCGFPVASMLNSFAEDQDSELGNKRMVCPDTRVLVVDDEPMNRIVAEGIFKDYQMEVVLASSGRKAIEICGREEFDILFIDHMMPEMDGVETLKQIRRLNKGEEADSFSAVAFTANAVSGAREMFLREGFDDFLPKPVEIPELEHVLKKVLPKSKIQYIDREEAARQKGGSGAENAGSREKAEGNDGEQNTGESPSAADGLALLKNAGINTTSGLNYCRNDETFYKELLRKFVSDAPQKAQDLDRMYKEKDYANYRIQVHSLKSLSKMIGADALSQTAKELEDAAKESDATYIKSHHREMLEEYQENVRLMAEAVGESADSAPTEDTETEELTETGAQELSECLEALKDCLTTYEEDKAQSILEKLKGMVFRGTPVRELVKEIAENVEDYEFEAAAEKTAALMERMKGGEAE